MVQKIAEFVNKKSPCGDHRDFDIFLLELVNYNYLLSSAKYLIVRTICVV